MTQFEERTPGPLYDVDDILAERSGELPEAPRYTGEDLHLKRLQIEGHVARAFADYVAPDQAASAELAPEAASERVGYPAEAGPDPADDDPVFQEPYLVMSFLEPQLAMLQLAIRLPLALRLLTDHRFGEAARSLRWLRQAQPMQNLLNRLERLSPETEISFSVADLLRLHQGTPFMALALVGDVMRDLDHFLSQPPSAREDESMEPLYLSAFFDAPPDADGDSPRRAIFNMVEGFVEMTRSALDTDLADEVPPAPERQAMLEAQAEIDDLSSLV
jgi:hypothetical protein